jgi:hypothetical protein
MLSTLTGRELWTALVFICLVGSAYAVQEFRRPRAGR